MLSCIIFAQVNSPTAIASDSVQEVTVRISNQGNLGAYYANVLRLMPQNTFAPGYRACKLDIRKAETPVKPYRICELEKSINTIFKVWTSQ